MSRSRSGILTRRATAVPNLGCAPADYANFPSGHIALLARGDCTFTAKAQLARDADASAVIIYNTDQGPVFSGTCDTDLPAYGISHSLGVILRGTENLVLAINVETRKEMSVTSNVFAETLTGDPRNVIIIGSHLDGVKAGAGVNDNGSGSSVNLEMALMAARCLPSPRNKVRFAWWAAEELGLLGSHHYVDDLIENNPEELDSISFNMNLDMLGSPNFFYGIYNGSGAAPDIREKCVIIQREFERYMRTNGKPYLLTPFSGRSDYGPFIEAGIPAGGLFSGAETVKNSTGRSTFGGLANTAYDPCYHDYCDSFDNISPVSITTLGSAAYHTVVFFANNGPIIQKLSENKKLASPGQYYPYEKHPDAISRY